MLKLPHYLTTLLLSGALLLGGCSSIKYEQDFKPGTQFSQHKSFAWRSTNSDPELQQLESVDKTRLRQLAQVELEQMGYSYQPDQPDLLIDINALTRISTGRGTGVGLSVGLPVGRSGSVGIGGGKLLDNQKEEGVILVDITDRASNTLIWRGSATAIPLNHFALKAEQQLSQVLRRLLTQFPPGD